MVLKCLASVSVCVASVASCAFTVKSLRWTSSSWSATQASWHDARASPSAETAMSPSPYASTLGSALGTRPPNKRPVSPLSPRLVLIEFTLIYDLNSKEYLDSIPLAIL